MNKHMRALVAAGLAGTLSLSLMAPPVFADTADDLAVAAQRLETLGTELSSIQAELDACGEELEACSYDIAQKQDEIAQTETELTAARSVLASRMRTNYKTGRTSLLSVILEAGSFEDLASRIYYMDKLADNDAGAISVVQGLQYQLNDQMAELEARQHDLERTLEETQQRVGEYEEKVAEAASYYQSLDAQLQAELEAQAAAEAAERERAEAEAMARAVEAAKEKEEEEAKKAAPAPAETQAEQGSTSTQEGDQQGSTSTKDTAPQEKQSTPQASEQQQSTSEQKESQDTKAKEETKADPEPAKADPQPQQVEKPSEPAKPAVDYGTYGGAGVDSAYSCIGCPYEWGAAGPNSFDCSGLVCYCYGTARGRSTYDMTSSLKASGDWKTSLSQLSYGDLVFTSSGHVGIYLGNGTFIHAPAPGRTVCVQEVFSFVGGGSYY